MSIFRSTIKETIFYFKSHQKLFWLIILFFAISLISGFFLPEKYSELIVEQLVEKIGSINSDNPWELFGNIFINNTYASLLLIVLGFTLFMPVLIITINGIGIGVVVNYYFQSLGVGVVSVIGLIVSLLPHGIFELPAVFFSAFLGLLLGLKIYFPKKILPDKNKKQVLVDVILIFGIIIIPFLLIAAFIESFVTGFLIKYFQ